MKIVERQAVNTTNRHYFAIEGSGSELPALEAAAHEALQLDESREYAVLIVDGVKLKTIHRRQPTGVGATVTLEQLRARKAAKAAAGGSF